MPKKRSLGGLSNRVYIKNVFAATRDSLNRLDTTLYQYARAEHVMRKESAELLRRFTVLEKQLAEKIKIGARYL